MKSKIDRVWDAFWSGGISNPLEVIEQITYLLFIRRLDDIQTLAEKKARITKTAVENPVFLPGQAHLRWSQFKNASPRSCTKPSPRRSSRSCGAWVTARPTAST
ncbi:type I restriction-modification system subunit M N-terminal domain-containing protein [Nocardioides sp. TF02-7]|uniref:type I restriction-modification system subunit M N-terminal domain-containing protein n=1 Tax=Nocardioides sp. TF02-7 TaxID=2917724 RepID=UPI001F05F594|nr:type I restriction-modification system subunit M N-terminal domain-containing protein [Nocardioides sp. TF02-7]UMG91508.1 type I restriction-modification system subunit M N-terminal domain-containing protein [Nocardioides sp. TF02-7]